MTDKKHVVLGLSGGIDSSTLVAYYCEKNYKIQPVMFQYGSKHNKYELKAANDIIKHYNLPAAKLIELPFIKDLFKSNLLLNQGEVPDGEYMDKTLAETVVPGRNLIFISIMAGLAWSLKFKYIAIAVHAGDHDTYFDCRDTFIDPMSVAVLEGTDDKIFLDTPFLKKSKTDIVKLGTELKVPYELTRSCYKDQQHPCGKCGTCLERLEAFASLGLTDPVKYVLKGNS